MAIEKYVSNADPLRCGKPHNQIPHYHFRTGRYSDVDHLSTQIKEKNTIFKSDKHARHPSAAVSSATSVYQANRYIDGSPNLRIGTISCGRRF